MSLLFSTDRHNRSQSMKHQPLFLITTLLLILQLSPTSPCTTTTNICSTPGPSKRPLPGCATFAQCDTTLNTVIAFQTCMAGSIFDTVLEICNWEDNTFCEVKSCEPSKAPSGSPSGGPSVAPSVGPTAAPTKTPTPKPSASPSQTPTESPLNPTAIPTISPSTSKDSILRNTILSKQSLIENNVLISYTSSGLSYPSRQYTFTDFYNALELVIAKEGGFASIEFLLYEGDESSYHYGLVNLAAFLSQSMVESIQYDACDELNWEEVAGRHAISNSCGQEGRSYQDEVCLEEESFMTCTVEEEMESVAISSGNGVRAPPPLTCGPGSGVGYYSGYWDTATGVEVADIPYSNANGRTDIEGCCWWGRGALSTRGTCNLGKFNWYMGKQAALDGRTSLYPNIDFCQYPEAVCSSDMTNEIRWTIAFFEWAERIQQYTDNVRWSYQNKLIEFVDGGMNDDSFIESVSRILSHGCHSEGCSSMDVRNAEQRRENFYLVINDVLNIPSLILEQTATPRPMLEITPQPTFRYNTIPDLLEPLISTKPQLQPALAPPTDTIQNPQAQPYGTPPSAQYFQETEMPTYDELILIEGSAGVRLVQHVMCCALLSCVFLIWLA